MLYLCEISKGGYMKNILLFLLIMLSVNNANAQQLQQTQQINNTDAEQSQQGQTNNRTIATIENFFNKHLPSYNVNLAEQMKLRQTSKGSYQLTAEDRNLCDYIKKKSNITFDEKACKDLVLNSKQPIDLKVEVIKNKFPKVPYDRVNYDKEKYQRQFDKYCNRFIKHYQSDLITNTPKTTSYSGDELKKIPPKNVGWAKNNIRGAIDYYKTMVMYLRGQNLSWIYLFNDLKEDIRKNGFNLANERRKHNVPTYEVAKMVERIKLMDKNYYNPEKCSTEPLFLTEEQITKFLNNEKPYFGDLTSKETDRFITCLEFFDFEQKCLSCNYDLVTKESFIARDYSDAEKCMFNILEDYQVGLAEAAQKDFTRDKELIYKSYKDERNSVFE